MMRRPALLICGLILISATIARGDVSAPSDKLSVFIETNSGRTGNYLRQELDYVDHVRDRLQAQVHVIATSQRAGGGGREYTLTFSGREEFAALSDTLRYSVYEGDSEEERQEKMLHAVELGLVRYLARTPMAERTTIAVAAAEEAEGAAVVDPWNSWLFRISANAWQNGSKYYRNINTWTSVQASRVTEEWKFRSSLSLNYSENAFQLSGGEEVSYSRSRYGSSSLVKSVNDHWSVGASAWASSSLYDNIDLGLYLGPAVEFNVFPYSESARRSLTAKYSIGFVHYDYDQETIYEKLEERLGRHGLELDLDLIRDWGSVGFRLEGRHYLHDFDLNRLDAHANLNLKLVKGLSLNLHGGYSAIHDQISLAGYDATDEDILLQRRELETQYNYSLSMGLSYSFGSIYNNVVNTRF